MTPSIIIALLQATAALLGVAQGSHATAASMQQAVMLAENTIQIVAQAEAPIGFSVPQNNGIYPNITDLLGAAYRDASGSWVHLGSSVQLIQGDTSFGDLNGDGLDDAAVIVTKMMPDGSTEYFLVAMLNQGGVMFDAAEFPLGISINISAHSITSGVVTLNTSRYQLVGISLVEE